MEGFILSHHWRDTSQGLVLEYWLSTDDGARCLQFHNQPLVCFYPKDQAHLLPDWQDLKQQELDLTHFDGHPVLGIYFNQYQSLLRFRQYCRDQDIPIWEDDIKPVDRFMMERFVRGSLMYAATDSSNSNLVINPKIKPTRYQPKLKLLSVDIETSMPTKQTRETLYSIGFAGEWSGDYPGERVKCVMMVGDSPPSDAPEWLQLFPDVRSLLIAANQWVEAFDPDVIVGWSVVNFDINVLGRMYRENGVPFSWGRNQHPIRLRDGQNNLKFVDIPGRVIVDGIDGLKSATWHFESFSLQHVSETLLGTGKKLGKHQDKVDNRGQAITDLFLHDKTALAVYNLQDCELVLDIFKHTHLLEFLIQRSFLTGHTLDRVGGSVAAFEYLYLPKLHRAGYISPNLGEGFDEVKAPGGFVMDSKPGFYRHVLVLDFKSLYPSIIRTFKVDPMGLIEGLKAEEDSDWIPGFNGARFHREKHFLPDIIRDLWSARDEAKQHNDHAASQAIKIIMNSFYGILGSTGCRFFDARLASSITLRGHEIIQTTADWINQQGYEVIYGDTDSVFVWLKDQHPENEARAVGDRLARELNQWWQAKLKQEFQLGCYLELEFEDHYQKFLMPTIRGSETGSKKRYAGLTDQGKMVFKGLEAVRSDWTPLAREIQTELYRRIFHDEDYLEYIHKMIHQVQSGLCDEKLVYRKRVRRSLDDYTKNIPPQIQAARKAEAVREQLGLTPQYQYGGWIEYVITVNGPEPVDYQTSRLDYEHYLEKQFAPVADGILHFMGTSFTQLTHPQRDIFL